MMEKTTEERRTYEKVVYFGKKTSINCVLAVISRFNYNASNGLILETRGQAIRTAVDAEEIVKK